MAWLVSALGALLAVGGGYALWSGSGYIRLDWGQAETVAGTVALSGGIVTIAVAALLFALRDLARGPALAGAAAGRAPAAAAPPLQPAVDPDGPVGFDEPEPPRAPAPRPAALLPREPVPREPPPREAAPPPAPPAAAPEPAVDAPTVVGRYEANGASYVLFSDGTIEVETEHGTHRFSSMAALKDHIEGQDAG